MDEFVYVLTNVYGREIMRSVFLQNDPEEDDTEEEEGEDAGYDSDDMDEIANELPFDPVSYDASWVSKRLRTINTIKKFVQKIFGQ